MNWAAGQACSAKKVLLYDDVASALSANFEALKAQEETARYPVAKTKSAASIPIVAAGGTVAGCFMLHNKLDCGVQCVRKLQSQIEISDMPTDTLASCPRILRVSHVQS